MTTVRKGLRAVIEADVTEKLRLVFLGPLQTHMERAKEVDRAYRRLSVALRNAKEEVAKLLEAAEALDPDLVERASNFAEPEATQTFDSAESILLELLDAVITDPDAPTEKRMEVSAELRDELKEAGHLHGPQGVDALRAVCFRGWHGAASEGAGGSSGPEE